MSGEARPTRWHRCPLRIEFCSLSPIALDLRSQTLLPLSSVNSARCTPCVVSNGMESHLASLRPQIILSRSNVGVIGN
jgi:hypothetical protein